MNITESAYRSLLREYDEKQLRARTAAALKRSRIEDELPELKQIEGEIASLHIKSTSAKLKGQSFDISSAVKKLNLEKESLLKSKGYTPDDLSIKYECPLCGDTGFTPDGPCRCFKSRITDILYDHSNIREILKKENFENFSFDYYSDDPLSEGSALSQKDLARRAYNTAKSFIRDFEKSDDNLFISGGTGVGKTFLSNCIAKEIIEQGFFVVYLSAGRLFEILSSASFQKDAASKELSGHIYDCNLLIIDDLGTELSNSFTAFALFNCINERLTGSRHTIISTNLSARQLRETYSERIFSRITNRYIMIKLLASDIRMKKRLEI